MELKSESVVSDTKQEGENTHPYQWSDEYMTWRSQDLTLDRDRDYPRFSREFFRRRWTWEAGEKSGNAAFAVTALFAAMRANKRQRVSDSTVYRNIDSQRQH